MTSPWIEILNTTKDSENELSWHGLFALQVNLLPFEVILRRRWGFNAAVYLQENLYRQKYFLESQHAIDIRAKKELPERRTLTIRCTNKPGQGILIAIIGKVIGQTEAAVVKLANSYCREIISIFPYDYSLTPAINKNEFHNLIGVDIFNSIGADGILQIKRYENPVYSFQDNSNVLGVWQAGPYANEQIWRALGGLPDNVFLNITLRPTLLTEEEKQTFLLLKQKTSRLISEQSNPAQSLIYKTWVEPLINRRLSPWSKYYYLQIHLVGNLGIPDDLIRAVGTTITEGTTEQPSPGYDILKPIDKDDAIDWQKKLFLLDIVTPKTKLAMPRITDIADLEEVFAVCRFPVPPEGGFPGIHFLVNEEEVKKYP